MCLDHISVSGTCRNSGSRSPFDTLTTALDMFCQAASIERGFRANFLPKEHTILKKEKTVTQKTVEAITTLNGIAKTIRKKRINNGAIIFDKTENKFELDKKNQPENIVFKTTKSSNKLIEEFMLLANKKVAEKMRKSKERFVYRVHDQPDQEKLKNLFYGIIKVKLPVIRFILNLIQKII